MNKTQLKSPLLWWTKGGYFLGLVGQLTVAFTSLSFSSPLPSTRVRRGRPSRRLARRVHLSAEAEVTVRSSLDSLKANEDSWSVFTILLKQNLLEGFDKD